jgi:iron complex transport system ATP-binding protein
MILTAENLEYRINARLTLRMAHFQVAAGEIVGLLGPNGAGKTTLLNIITGITKPHRGRVLLNGRELFSQTALEAAAQRSVMRAAHIGDGAQGLNVREIIALGNISNPMHPRLANVLVSAFAHRFDLVELLDTDFAVLSSGEKQRVHAARIFLQLHGRERGHLVFLDEPYAHLDARHTQILAQELAFLKRDGAGIVVILHDINFAARHCDRICFIKDAEIVSESPAAKIYDPALLGRVYDASFTVLKSGKSRYVVSDF